MTFVLALTGKKSVWMLTDRRLSSARGHVDDGIKTVHFDGSDGQGLMGYAGLGRTAGRRQPSDWIKDQLVGRSKLTIEESVSYIAEAVKAQLPDHLRNLPHSVASHDILAPVIVNGEPRLYHVGISPRGYVHTRYVNEKANNFPPRIGIAGSGALHLPPAKTWYRSLLKLLAEYERNRLKPLTVADRLADLNNQVAKKDRFVSKKCIVAWRGNGGGTQFYDGTERVGGDCSIPTVGNGMDIQAILKGSLPFMIEEMKAMLEGREFKVDGKEIEDAVNREHRPPERDLK